MAGTAVHFPRASYYTLTWSIPDNYGGMTKALLQRSRVFQRLGGLDVETLTMDDRPDYAEVEERLRAAGELVDGVRLRNLWDDLRERTLNEARKVPASVEPLTPARGDRVIEHDGVVLLRERPGEQDALRQQRSESAERHGRRDLGESAGGHEKSVFDEDRGLPGADRFRRDGSLLATERVRGGRRRITLYDTAGRPVREWNSKWSLYRWWLDRVIGKKLSYLIIDSKTCARFIPDYRREHVVTVHVVHASHRAHSGTPTLRESRDSTLRRTCDFDAVIVLCERQKSELTDDLSVLGVDVDERIRVVPNCVQLPAAGDCEHARGEGIVIASLDQRKRVDRAVAAVAKAHSEEQSVTLDIYGDGACAAQLDENVRSTDASAFVLLHGYDRDARARFQHADFSLLTSTSEGFPLVLIESMAAGCIPIAFDVRYGPADIIRNGVDGYVVPEGDTNALSERIVQLQRMPSAQLKSMRRHAMRRSRKFSDLAVARRWARELQWALDAKRIRDAAGEPLPIRLRRRAGVVRRRARRFVGR